MPIVEIDALTHQYPAARRPALSQVSFQVERGEIFALLGPNGGGKTTLFRILSTLLTPDSGTARIAGFDILRQKMDVRRKLGVLFQSPALDRKLTVRENLVHQGHLFGLSGIALRSRIAELLTRFGIADRTSERVETLSGGLQRRVEIAKALLHQPEVLLLDEPATGLDPGARIELRQALRSSGATILLTTHLFEEADDAHRIAILDQGRLVALGTPTSLKMEIGGDVLTLVTRDPEKLSAGLLNRMQQKTDLVHGHLRLEHADAHRLLPRIIETFPGEIESATLGKPTLEDVFIRRTGRRFE